MNKTLLKLEKVFGKDRIRENEPMSLHTTFKIGGPAQFYIEADKIDDLVKLINTAKQLKIPFFVLGGGSNILVSDKGIKGLVIRNNCRHFEVMQMKGRVKNQSAGWRITIDSAFVLAQSGVIMNQLVRFTIEQGLSGLEYQLGLPGTVGGAIFMNSNFPKKEISVGDCVYRVKLLTRDGIKEVDRSYFHFGYDRSILQETRELVLAVIFKLFPARKEVLWERAMEALNHRNTTQPKGASAGCIFRNISLSSAIRMSTPNHTTSAGYLIDKAGLKGRCVGDAMVSDLHANYILNLGKATASDVVGLIDIIKEEVLKKFAVKLELEIRSIGFED